MAINGVHHIGVATSDYEGTVKFYTEVVGWPIAWQDQNFGPDGKEVIRHVFFDAGGGTYLAFMCSLPGSPMFPESWATNINDGLGMRLAAYHFSFAVDSEESLNELKLLWRSRGLDVSGVMDHGWCKSIYFRDPVNGLMLEASVQTKVFDEDDKLLKPRAQGGFQGADEEELELTSRVLGMPVTAIRAMGGESMVAQMANGSD